MARPIQYQIVARARELIADERNWCTGVMARTRRRWWWTSRVVAPEDKKAAQFCAVGALRRAAHDLMGAEGRQRVMQVSWEIKGSHWGLMAINDHEGHAAVLAAFDRYLNKS